MYVTVLTFLALVQNNHLNIRQEKVQQHEENQVEPNRLVDAAAPSVGFAAYYIKN